MADIIDEQLARELGASTPTFLDASILDFKESAEIVREDVKQNRVQFVFPAGLNKVDLLEECRALTKLDDFDVMYDLTMQMLEGKPVTITLLHDDGTKSELCSFQVTDRYMNLRGVGMIDEYPVLVTWLTEFIGAHILKKFPVPSSSAPQTEGQGKTRQKGKQQAAT